MRDFLGIMREVPTYLPSIASINTSIRDKKNILEGRLEKQTGASFNMKQEETENLLKRLKIESSQSLSWSFSMS
jgi:hypothetical protein